MIVVRSWPEEVPLGRAHVVDDLPRFVMHDYDYRRLTELGDDVLLIEWDIAVSMEDLTRFAGQARSEPGQVRVAPYRLYAGTGSNTALSRPVWAHRRYFDPAIRATCAFVDDDEPTCHLFGLGMAYLPHAVLTRFTREFPGHFSDGTFSAWHHANVAAETPISWDVRPVHLHYPIEELT